jgi:hypothetical protein
MPEEGGLGMLSTEKREQDRIILSLPVEYYRADPAARSTGYLQRGYTINASENGLMVISQHEIPKDSDLRIKLFFCFPDLGSVETLSHVIWVARREKDSDFLAGMKIVRAEQEDRRKWEQFLDNLFSLKPF